MRSVKVEYALALVAEMQGDRHQVDDATIAGRLSQLAAVGELPITFQCHEQVG